MGDGAIGYAERMKASPSLHHNDKRALSVGVARLKRTLNQ